MIYFCADDYGLCNASDRHINECCENGILNKISILPGCRYNKDSEINLSLHINLVEGTPLLPKEKVNLLVSEDGNFRHSFEGLFFLSMSAKRKQLEKQIYEELKAQISYFRSEVSPEAPFMLDSHQHVHMIPLIFRTLMKVIRDEGIKVRYLRIPDEPLMPYIKAYNLYFTYRPVNLIKQWLLKFLWQINKKEFNKEKIPTALFMGILFSGCMDEKRVKRILPYYISLAKKRETDIEVLFHPGYIEEKSENKNIKEKFSKFYFSEGRKIEYDTVLSLQQQKKEVFLNALY